MRRLPTRQGDHVAISSRCCQRLMVPSRLAQPCFSAVGEAREHTRIRRARSNYIYANSVPATSSACGFVMPSTACLLPT